MAYLSTLLNTLIKEVMSPNVLILLEDDPISLVYQVFHRSHVSAAPIINSSGEYIGIISKTDLTNPKFLEVIKGGQSLETIPIKELMNRTPLICISENTTLEEASKLMSEKHVHRVFVKDEVGSIVGVVSTFDIVKLIAIVDSKQNFALSDANQMKFISQVI